MPQGGGGRVLITPGQAHEPQRLPTRPADRVILLEVLEFRALGRQLLANDVALHEIQAALGYEGTEGVQRAFESARVTTVRDTQLGSPADG